MSHSRKHDSQIKAADFTSVNVQRAVAKKLADEAVGKHSEDAVVEHKIIHVANVEPAIQEQQQILNAIQKPEEEKIQKVVAAKQKNQQLLNTLKQRDLDNQQRQQEIKVLQTRYLERLPGIQKGDFFNKPETRSRLEKMNKMQARLQELMVAKAKKQAPLLSDGSVVLHEPPAQLKPGKKLMQLDLSLLYAVVHAAFCFEANFITGAGSDATTEVRLNTWTPRPIATLSLSPGDITVILKQFEILFSDSVLKKQLTVGDYRNKITIEYKDVGPRNKYFIFKNTSREKLKDVIDKQFQAERQARKARK